MAISVSLAEGVGGWVWDLAGSAGSVLDLTEAELSAADPRSAATELSRAYKSDKLENILSLTHSMGLCWLFLWGEAATKGFKNQLL